MAAGLPANSCRNPAAAELTCLPACPQALVPHFTSSLVALSLATERTDTCEHGGPRRARPCSRMAPRPTSRIPERVMDRSFPVRAARIAAAVLVAGQLALSGPAFAADVPESEAKGLAVSGEIDVNSH